MFHPISIDWRTFIGVRDGKRHFRVDRVGVGLVSVETSGGVTSVGPLTSPLAMPTRWKQEQDFARMTRLSEVPVG